MSEQVPLSRKKISLKSSRQDKTKDNPITKRIQRVNQAARENVFESTPELAALYKKRMRLLSQIEKMSNRLLFVSSSPLQEAHVELKKRDVQLIVEIIAQMKKI